MLWSYYLVQVWVFWKLLSGPSLFFLQHRLPKNTLKIEDSAHIFGKKFAHRILEVIIWSKLAFFKRTQLGPDNNFQKCIYFVIVCFEKCAKIPIFIVFCEKQQNRQKNAPPKTITLHILQNTG